MPAQPDLHPDTPPQSPPTDRPPRAPIPNGRPNPYFEAHRQRLADLRADLVSSIDRGGRNILAAEQEWDAIPRQLRLFVLVFCGIDDAEGALVKQWPEMSPIEREKIAAVLRELRKRLLPVVALTL